MWTWTPTMPTTPKPTFFLPSPSQRTHTHHPKFTKTVIISSSNPNPKSPKHKPKPNPQNEEKQVTSSDLLWAWQRASTEKRMKKNQKKKQQQVKNMKQWSSDSEDDHSLERSDVRPLCIRSDWATRLDELEKRLQELKFIV